MSNDKQQTAVEWLVEKMLNQDWYTYKSLEFIEQAKEMEKEQTMDAFNQGYRDGEVDASNPTNMSKDVSEFSNAENYYKLTYGGNK